MSVEQPENLRDVVGDPAVTVVMDTNPSERMADLDVSRLAELVRLAERRLTADLAPSRAGPIVGRLQELAQQAREGPTEAGLGLFLGAQVALVVTFPFPVDDEVVVDGALPARATQPALGWPEYRVLVLSEREARLFEGAADRLVERKSDGFPVRAQPLPCPRQRGRGRQAKLASHRAEALARHLRAVDRALGRAAQERPAPLVLAGVEHQAAAFRRSSTHAASVLGRMPGAHLASSPERLAALARPLVDAYADARRQWQWHTRLRRLPHTAQRHPAARRRRPTA